MTDRPSQPSRSDGRHSVSNQADAQHQQQQLQQQLKMLALGFVHLTGGMDTGNRPVLCFPPRQIIRMHLNNVAAPQLTAMIDYLVSVAPAEAYAVGANRQTRGLAFLADFRACSQSIFRIVIDALETVQSHSPGSVGVFYVLMPRSKELSKSLQKMLGLYQKKSFLPSRKSGPDPNAKSFQSVLLPTSQELFQFVSKANLMLDFGGSLNYDHEAWMKLRTSFDSLLLEVASIADKAPDALQSLADLPQQAGDDQDETAVQESAQSMQDQFQRVTAALGLEAASEKVAQLLAACLDPKNYPETRPLAGNILLQSYIERLQRLQTRLEELKALLRDRWKQSEAGLLVDGRISGHKRAAAELGDWLERWGKEALKRADARNIANQQMAEDAREKLRLQVLEPSTAKLRECRTLVTQLRQLAAAAPQRSMGREPNEAAQLADQLEAKQRGFSERVKSAREKLDRICDFFHACSKTLKWYQRCLKKLPLDLLQPVSHRGNHRLQSNEPLPIVARWPEISRSFSLQHPSPSQAQLDELKESMSLIDDVEIKKEAQLLVHRASLLRKLLASTPATLEGGITVGQYRELLDGRENQAEPDGDPAFASLEPSQSLAGSSDEAEFEASPAVARKVAPSFQFPPERADDLELQRGGRFRRRTGRSMASSSGTEIVEVIPEPIVINHRLMARPPARGFDMFDEEDQRQEARKEEDAFSRKAVTSLESLPKEETVRRYLENMVITPPPMTATTDESLGSGSHMGRSLSNLVGELRDLKEALFYSGNRAQMAPVARRGRRFQTPHRQTHRQLLPPAVAGEMLRSRSEQNLASHAPGRPREDVIGQRQRKLLLLQLDDPPSTRGVAYPVEVIDIQKVVGDIRDITSDRYRHQPHQKLPQYSSRNRLTGGEAAAAAGYSMSRMSDTDPVLRNYSFDDLVGEDDLTRDIRPSRHSDNFLLTSPDNRQPGAGGGGRSHSPRSLLMMSPPPPPSIPEEPVDAVGAAIAAERLRWRRRDNRMWLHNTYNLNSHH